MGFVHWNENALCKLDRNLGKLKIFIHTGLSNFVYLFCLKLTTFASILKSDQKFSSIKYGFAKVNWVMRHLRWLVILELLKNTHWKRSFPLHDFILRQSAVEYILTSWHIHHFFVYTYSLSFGQAPEYNIITFSSGWGWLQFQKEMLLSFKASTLFSGSITDCF